MSPCHSFSCCICRGSKLMMPSADVATYVSLCSDVHLLSTLGALASGLPRYTASFHEVSTTMNLNSATLPECDKCGLRSPFLAVQVHGAHHHTFVVKKLRDLTIEDPKEEAKEEEQLSLVEDEIEIPS